MDTAVSIRPATDDDARVIPALFRESVHGLAHEFYSPKALAAWADGLDEHGARALIRGSLVLVAERDGQPAGFAALKANVLEMLYVHPGHARSGVASTLLAQIETLAARRGIEALTVRASLAAQPFFKARGFLLVRGLEVVRAGVEIFCFEMEKQLAPAMA